MTILQAVNAVKTAWDTYSTVNSIVVDEVKATIRSAVEEVSDKTFESALATLEDAEISGDADSEIKSAITQLRIALGTTESAEKKTKITAAIAVCYITIKQPDVARKYAKKSVINFSDAYSDQLNKYDLGNVAVQALKIPSFFNRHPLIGMIQRNGIDQFNNTIVNPAAYKEMIQYVRSFGVTVDPEYVEDIEYAETSTIRKVISHSATLFKELYSEQLYAALGLD